MVQNKIWLIFLKSANQQVVWANYKKKKDFLYKLLS